MRRYEITRERSAFLYDNLYKLALEKVIAFMIV